MKKWEKVLNTYNPAFKEITNKRRKVKKPKINKKFEYVLLPMTIGIDPSIQESKLITSEPTEENKPDTKCKRMEFCYRVEHPEKGGVYSGCHGARTPSSQNGYADHPCPDYDQSLKSEWNNLYKSHEYEKYFFGFSNMDQFHQWMFDPEYFQHLKDHGLKIGIYQTNDYFIGDTQMIFRKASAKLIGYAELI